MSSEPDKKESLPATTATADDEEESLNTVFKSTHIDTATNKTNISPPPPSNGAYIAGSSMKFFETAPGTKVEDVPMLTHNHCRADTFSCRVGPNYNWYKSKAASPEELYDFAGADLLRSSSRVDRIGERVQFPEEWTVHTSTNQIVPQVLVINFQLPADFSTSWFTEVTDGDGWSMVYYFKLKEKTVEALKNMETASPALRLFVDYCTHAPEAQAESAWSGSTNPWVGRFKAMVRCENIDQFGLPSFITSYNAKPALIRNTGTLHRADTFLEMDINVHRFASLPKKALEVMFNKFHEMLISVAFCIESRGDEEMPETIFGCCTINKPNHALCPTAPQDWLKPLPVSAKKAGTSS